VCYSQGIIENIAGLDVELVSQKILEEEVGTMSIVALSTYLIDRLVKASKMLVSAKR